MEFVIEKDVFLKGLQKVQGIIEKKTSMPILANILIESSDDKIEITATDLEVALIASYPAKVLKNGKVTVSGKKLFEIIKELPEDEIYLKIKENDWIEIKCQKVKFNIVGLPSDDFPKSDIKLDENLIEIESSTLRDMIEKTSYSICNDESKYNLNGIFTTVDTYNDEQHLKMVSTDGHRLSVALNKLTSMACQELIDGVILPKKGVYEVKKLTEEGDAVLKLGFADNNAIIKKNELILSMRLVNGEFPDYNRVIPTSNDLILKSNREQLLQSVRRMSILSNEKVKGIMLDVKNNLISISSNNPELGDAAEELDIEYSGDDFSVRFNARYLMDVLMACSSEHVLMKFKNEISPSIIVPDDNDENLLAVIMPMRL